MTPERFKEIRELFDAAVEVEPRSRPAFVRSATADIEIQNAVLQMLAARDESPDFLMHGAGLDAQTITKTSSERDPAYRPGTRLAGRFEIVSLVGRGGMGAVYQAKDHKLHRTVALKTVASNSAADSDRSRRLVQEARAASSLSHPNIATIYDIAEDSGTDFIAMEYVRGVSLDTVIGPQGMDVHLAVDYGIQMADALACAHATGIVHRDIKPGNVMVTDEGRIKVLDFGLARFVDRLTGNFTTDYASVQTAEGVIVGTVAYMSPEQAEGRPVDARSDIFSFGSVLYEMLSGVRPFAGESHISTLASILHKEPVPLRQVAPGVPEPLAELVAKCLKKEPSHRWHTAHELAAALKQIEHRPSQRRSWTRLATVVAGVILLVAVLIAVKFAKKPAPVPLRAMRMTRLTTTGNVNRAAISKDGKYVAYAAVEWSQSGQTSIWVRQVGASGNIRIATLPAAQFAQRIALSPDGRYVYYIAVDSATGILTRVPVLGGRPEQVLTNVDTGPAFSPDGTEIAFGRFTSPDTVMLLVAKSDGTGERVISSKRSVGAVGQPDWSPDGSRIVWVNRTAEANSVYDALIVSSPHGGAEQVIPSRKWWGTWAVQWLSGDDGLLISARESPGGALQLWHIALPDGAVRPVTNDLNHYRGISSTADGKAAVTVQTFASSTLWTVETSDTSAPVQITHGTNRDDGIYGVFWASNGRILYSFSTSGRPEIWTFAPGGSDQQQITNSGAWPAAAPDGTWVAFGRWDEDSGVQIWRINSDGSGLKQVTFHAGFKASPQVSPDGRWIYYLDGGDGFSVYRVPADGGRHERVFHAYAGLLSVAKRQQLAALWDWNANLDPALAVNIIDLQRGVRQSRFAFKGSVLRIAPDGRSLLYLTETDGHRNVWLRPIPDGPAKQVTSLKDDKITFTFDISPDGRHLVLARGTVAEDVVLLTDTSQERE